MSAPANTKPIIRWAGGKTRLLPELLARMPAQYGRYYEPFAGGAALFFRLVPERAVLADLNLDLVTVYSVVKLDVEGLIRCLEHHANCHSRDYYYAERERWNEWTPGSCSGAERAASFIYLNKTCFNGLWRVNRDGGFNVPMGKYKKPAICVPNALRAASRALAQAEVRHGRYENSLDDAQPGDFVYFDPPYDGTFTAYTADAFGPDQQRELAEAARALVGYGVQVMLSNSDTPFVRELYADFRVDTVQCGRGINSDTTKRGAVNELIITGGYEKS